MLRTWLSATGIPIVLAYPMSAIVFAFTGGIDIEKRCFDGGLAEAVRYINARKPYWRLYYTSLPVAYGWFALWAVYGMEMAVSCPPGHRVRLAVESLALILSLSAAVLAAGKCYWNLIRFAWGDSDSWRLAWTWCDATSRISSLNRMGVLRGTVALLSLGTNCVLLGLITVQ
jgi:hypothetical protein